MSELIRHTSLHYGFRAKILYEHAAAQPAAPHNVAGGAIMHLHPDLLPQKAMHLGNQLACMIAEYHLTASA